MGDTVLPAEATVCISLRERPFFLFLPVAEPAPAPVRAPSSHLLSPCYELGIFLYVALLGPHTKAERKLRFGSVSDFTHIILHVLLSNATG